MRTIKIVGIISSLRENGNTAPLARAALQCAREMGTEVTEITLSGCPPAAKSASVQATA